MKTKTILLMAALAAAGIATSKAQTVYSVNSVGFIGLSLGPGYSLMANQLNNTNNKVSTLFPNMPDDCQLIKWNTASQGFASADFTAGGVWFDQDFNVATTTLSPGEGAFFFNPGATSIPVTLVGEVPQGTNLTVNLPANYALISVITPQASPLHTIGFPATPDMQYITFSSVAQSYSPAYSFVGVQPGFDSGWSDGDFNPVNPTPAVGEGFFVFNALSPSSWVRSFNVNN